MRRIGLTGRLLLLVSLGFLLIEALATSAWLTNRREATSAEVWLPFPDQLAAMVVLFDQTPPDQRSLLERAFSSGPVLITVLPDRPGWAGDGTDLPLPRFSAALRDYSGALRGRDLVLMVRGEGAFPIFPRLFGLMQAERVRLAVSLADGSYLVVQSRQPSGLTFGGVPVGLGLALVSALLTLGLLGAVWHETRPLRDLRETAEGFGQTLSPRPLTPRGAPDVRELIVAFNDMQRRIVRLDHGRTDMIAAIGHDIRTPLTRLRLRLRKLDPEIQDAAERDIDAVLRVADQAARFAEADLAPREDRVDLRALLADLAAEPAVSLSDATPGRPALMRGNTELVSRALANLVANALRFGQSCRIGLAVAGDTIRITLDDDGPGIAPDERERLLHPFERGEASRNVETGGSGLGLALADRIVRRHDGRLELMDGPSGGLRVVLGFPALDADA